MNTLIRKKPQQQRSVAMVSFILDAATRVLECDSLSGFNTNAVATAAGISIGSLYQYFPNKSALIVALIEQNQAKQQQALEALIERFAVSSLKIKIQALVRFAISHQYANPVFAAALDHEERRLPIQDLLKQSELQLLRTIQAFLGNQPSANSKKISLQQVSDCIQIAKAMVEAEPINLLSRKTLVSRMNRALLGYLQLH